MLKDSESDFYGEAARILRDFIGDLFGVTGSALTPDEIETLLTGEGIQTGLVGQIKRVLEHCDAGRYGAAVNGMPPQQELFREISQAARELRRSR